MSPAGLTRGSIFFARTFLQRGWIAGSSPAMTDAGTLRAETALAPQSVSARGHQVRGARAPAILQVQRRAQHGRDLVGELLEHRPVAALPQIDSAIELGQLGQRRVLPDRERGLLNATARQHHDAEPGHYCRLQASNA